MTTAAALAVALPSAGLVIAIVVATWHGLSGRMNDQGRRLDALDGQQGQILRSLGRIEGRLGVADEPAEVA